MASGAQIGAENVAAFHTWRASQSNDDFLQNIRGGQLSRTYITKGIGCSRSALLQNPQLRAAISDLESELRKERVLPPLSGSAAKEKAGTAKAYDSTKISHLKAEQRASALEKEVVALRAENEQLKDSLARFGELSEIVSELGLMPR